jgi:CubicO group peptidase (beta-lactamase class C family)
MAGLFVPSAVHSQSRSELDSIVSTFFAEMRPTGLAVGVISNRGFRYVSTHGLAQRGTSRKITSSTVFHLASVTKTFTGIAVMQLVERGAFSLDDPISKHLPAFKLEDSRYRDITIRRLLNHSSGLPHAETYNWDKPQTGDSALVNYVRSISSLRLLFDPGDRWSYSDVGYEILGALVAKASRMSFEEYVDRNILRPAGMNNSTLLLTPVREANLAAPHTPDSSNGAVVSAVYPYNREHAPSSTMHADIQDALLWAETLLPHDTRKKHAILPRAVIEDMWRPTLRIELPEGAIAGIPHHLAMGLTYFTWQQGQHRVIWHGGDDVGFSTSLMMAPDDGVAVVVLSNQRLVPVHKLASSLLSVVIQAQR